MASVPSYAIARGTRWHNAPGHNRTMVLDIAHSAQSGFTGRCRRVAPGLRTAMHAVDGQQGYLLGDDVLR
jgi:hypothetical protein